MMPFTGNHFGCSGGWKHLNSAFNLCSAVTPVTNHVKFLMFCGSLQFVLLKLKFSENCVMMRQTSQKTQAQLLTDIMHHTHMTIQCSMLYCIFFFSKQSARCENHKSRIRSLSLSFFLSLHVMCFFPLSCFQGRDPETPVKKPQLHK